MRRFAGVFLLTVILLLAADLQAGERRRALRPVVADEISVTFVSLAADASVAGSVSDAVLDVGRIAQQPLHGRAAQRTTRQQTVGIRIDGSGRSMQGTATLRAHLEDADPRYSIRIDGITLGSAPLLIDARVPIGAVVPHRIEIDVPVTAAEGLLTASIRWDVTTD